MFPLIAAISKLLKKVPSDCRDNMKPCHVATFAFASISKKTCSVNIIITIAKIIDTFLVIVVVGIFKLL